MVTPILPPPAGIGGAEPQHFSKLLHPSALHRQAPLVQPRHRQLPRRNNDSTLSMT